MSERPHRLAIAVVALLVPLTAAATPPGPDEFVGPTISLDRARVAPGDQVVVTAENFASPRLTVVVCGNEGRRGSADCDMPAGKGTETTPGEVRRVAIDVTAPPAPCPCVVRVVGSDGSEFALAPLVVEGHPVADVVDGASLEGLIDTTLDVVESPDHLLDAARSSLGGATRFRVTVSVRNRSTETLTAGRVTGDARKGDEVAAVLDFGVPGPIPPGQTWRRSIEVVVGAVSIGEVQWQVVTSGAGPSTTTSVVSERRPWLLFGAAVTVLACFTALIARLLVRRRAEAEPENSRPGEAVDDALPAGELDGADQVAYDLVSTAGERL
jgi:hypothetical protein